MILQGNCLARLYDHAADGADVQIVDPPYSPKVHSKATSAGVGALNGGRSMGVRKRDLGFDCLSPALMLRIAYYASRVRRWTVVFSDLESVGTWIAAMRLHGVEYVRTVPWVRWSQPQLSGDRPPSGAEAVLVFHRSAGTKRDGTPKPVKKHWNGPGGRVAYRAEEDAYEHVARAEYAAKSLRGKDKYSCEKPLDLMLALVSDYSDPGELVFDPCAGMGTTCLAARLLGREALGLERTAAVAAAAWERVRNGELLGEPDGGLSERDEERACRWILETREEASATPAPRAANGSDVKTWERAQRRLADVERLIKYGSR